MVRLRAPVGCSTASVGGVQYRVVHGHVAVPTDAVAPLAAHGFTVVEAEPPATHGDESAGDDEAPQGGGPRRRRRRETGGDD